MSDNENIDNTPDEDVEGHRRAPRVAEDDEDVEGHRRAPRVAEDDDVEGHRYQKPR